MTNTPEEQARVEEVRGKLSLEFYKAKALAGDMPFSQAAALHTVMADLAYAKANQILNSEDKEGNRMIGILDKQGRIIKQENDGEISR